MDHAWRVISLWSIFLHWYWWKRQYLCAFLCQDSPISQKSTWCIRTELLSDSLLLDFFMLIQEGWSLAELFRVRCVVAAPYVVPYRYYLKQFLKFVSNKLFRDCWWQLRRNLVETLWSRSFVPFSPCLKQIEVFVCIISCHEFRSWKLVKTTNCRSIGYGRHSKKFCSLVSSLFQSCGSVNHFC